MRNYHCHHFISPLFSHVLLKTLLLENRFSCQGNFTIPCPGLRFRFTPAFKDRRDLNLFRLNWTGFTGRDISYGVTERGAETDGCLGRGISSQMPTGNNRKRIVTTAIVWSAVLSDDPSVYVFWLTLSSLPCLSLSSSLSLCLSSSPSPSLSSLLSLSLCISLCINVSHLDSVCLSLCLFLLPQSVCPSGYLFISLPILLSMLQV